MTTNFRPASLGSAVEISLIVAVARNGVIGADGDLAWKIRDDLKWFKKQTLNKPIIMGRKTFDSIGKALPGRDNIVLTRDNRFTGEDLFIVRAVNDAITLGAKCAIERAESEIMVIGGGGIYRQFLDLASRIYMTKVDAEVAGDVVFPDVDLSQWQETSHGTCRKDNTNEFDCEFLILNRVK